MRVDKNQFETILHRAVSGDHDALEKILEIYEPLIRKYSFHNNKFDEDLHQYLLIHIALNIGKFIL